jgi:hypothetical protein
MQVTILGSHGEEGRSVFSCHPLSKDECKGDASLVYEGEAAWVTNGVLEVTGRHPRTLPVYANDHAADLVK